MNFAAALPPAKNVVELFQHYVASMPSRVIATFVEDDGTENTLSFADLDRAARNLGREVARVVKPGDRVLVAYDSGREFAVGLWAALYAGAIAVPVDPPGPARPAANLARIVAVARDSGAICCVGSRETRDAIGASAQARSLVDELAWIEPDLAKLFADDGGPPLPVPTQTDADVVLLQYASGSTGAPKGTIATNANVLRMSGAFLFMSSLDTPLGKPDIEVAWLPLTHSSAGYGFLIKCLTGAVMPACYLTPGAFARSPIRWLRAISKYPEKEVYSVAPNFALDWCVSSTTEADREGLDLRGWTQFLCMGERVRAETWRAFVEAFEPRGFRPKLFLAGYGTSETGYITGSMNGGRRAAFDRSALDDGRLVSVTEGGAELVSSSGFALPGATLLIVDPETREVLPEGRVGEIWVQTPAVMSGYWNRPQETKELFHATTADGKGPFFRTGDLGATEKDDLFITGRRKSVIVVRGRKHYAEDIEATLERSIDWLDANSSIAFSDEIDGVEELFVAVEPRSWSGTDTEALTDEVRGLVGREFGVRVHEVLFLSPSRLPRTGIGKVARVTCRDLFRAGELPMAARCGAFGKSAGAATIADVRAVLAEPNAERRVERMTSFVRSLLAATLAVPAEALSPTKTWNELGVDSMTGVRFHGELLRHLGAELPASTLYNYPTIARLAELICDKLTKTSAVASEPSWKRGAASSLAALDVENMTEEAAEAALLAHLDAAR